jgi:predicted nuclease of predicted toxin-antitoxin system
VRILLDESLPRRLGTLLAGHDVSTVQTMGWSGVQNGELLHLAATQFDVFVTPDQSLSFQQNLAQFPIAVVVLVASSNRLDSIKELVPALLEILSHAVPGTLRVSGSLEQ